MAILIVMEPMSEIAELMDDQKRTLEEVRKRFAPIPGPRQSSKVFHRLEEVLMSTL